MIYAKLAVQNHSPVYAGPRDRRQTCPGSAAKNSSTASGHARDLMGPSADISRSLGVLVSRDFVGSNVKCHLTGPAKLLGQVRRLELHKNEEMIH